MSLLKDIFLRMTVREIEGEKVVYYHKPGEEEKVTSLRKLNDPLKERKRTLSQTKHHQESQTVNEIIMIIQHPVFKAIVIMFKK